MNRLFFLLVLFLSYLGISAQPYPQVTIQDINTPMDLANCNDTSIHYMDTVTFVGYVVTDGGLSEIQSSSIVGANGIRPFIWVNDTANDGAIAANTGLAVMGVNWNTNVATAGITALNQGQVVEITGVVTAFNGNTDFRPLNNSSVNVLSVPPFPKISPNVVPLGDLNDQNLVNQLSTGEAWQGVFVKINDVVVTDVTTFGSGSNQRVYFTISDQSGNSMQVYDYFLAQRLPSYQTLNPNSPASTGSFTPPVVGAVYSSVSGVITHSANGCLGTGGTGYRLLPFKPGHYSPGPSPPIIYQVTASPKVPTSTDPISLSAEITDTDGSIDTAQIFWSTNSAAPTSAFNVSDLVHTAGSNYQFGFNAQPNGTNIYYYLRVVDNDSNVSFYPELPAAQQDTNLAHIYVRDNGLSIMDVQTPIGGGGDSPFDGGTVSVRGYVTAAATGCDLGYFYIQDTGASEYAGLALTGSLVSLALQRGQLVEVEGVIDELFSLTVMNVQNINVLNDHHMVMPVVLDPSDSAGFHEMEKYEGMLVSYKNPNGDSIVVSDPDIGFGEYRISTDTALSGENTSRRVLAGRQSGTGAQSSLHFQLVSDSVYGTQDGQMAFPPVVTQQGQYLDALTGILWYSFGTYKLTPRNNYDAIGPNIDLNTSGCNIAGYGTDVVTACNSYTWTDGVTYTSSTNSPIDTFVTAAGRDSVVMLKLTILESDYIIDSVRTCDSYTWTDGKTYSTGTTAPVQVFTNADGCDSVVNLHLDIVSHLSGVDSVTACHSYTWTDGLTYTSSTTAPTDTFIMGSCDSIVSLHLHIDTVDVSVSRTGVDLNAGAQAATYRWLDCDSSFRPIAGATAQTYTAIGNGSFAVEVTQNGCVDTSGCIGINDFSLSGYENTDLEVYPNPNDGTFFIKADAKGKVDVEIFDASGRLIATREIAAGEPVFMHLDQPAGIYILQVRSGGDLPRRYKLSIQ